MAKKKPPPSGKRTRPGASHRLQIHPGHVNREIDIPGFDGFFIEKREIQARAPKPFRDAVLKNRRDPLGTGFVVGCMKNGGLQ